MPTPDLIAIADAIARATPADPTDAALLAEAQDLLSGEQTLSVSETARLLGVSSPATIHNWLEHGHFPGAFRTIGGHRRFRLADIVRVQARIAQTKAENASGHIEVPDYGDGDPWAERSAALAELAADRANELVLRKARVNELADELMGWLAPRQSSAVGHSADRLYRLLGQTGPTPAASLDVLRAALERHLDDTVATYANANASLAASDAYDAACDAAGVAIAADAKVAILAQGTFGPKAPAPGDEAGFAYLVRLVSLLTQNSDLNDQECLRSLRQQYVADPLPSRFGQGATMHESGRA
jgi:DNA-binding transcriptional MerR regulator